MTTDERWQSAKSLRKVVNVIYIINLTILGSIFLIKCDHFKNIQQTNSGFISNASIKSVSSVNVRMSPSLTSPVTTKVANNDRVFIMDNLSNPDSVNGQSGYWFKVKIDNGSEGFIWSATVKQD